MLMQRRSRSVRIRLSAAELRCTVLVGFQHGDMCDAVKDIEEFQTGADALELRVDLLDAKSHEEIRVQVCAHICVKIFHSCVQSHEGRPRNQRKRDACASADLFKTFSCGTSQIFST